MENKNENSLGRGINVLLTIVFVVLKLAGVINWSWLWVICPLWIDVLFTIIVLIVITIIDNITKKKRYRSKRIKW